MAMHFTEEQQKVIDTRDKNILVSAAAGSGKTAVLVERIIKRVLDLDNPIDIDRLLVVTFTKAAALEMKERIGASISKVAEEEPENEHLQKQLSYIHNAQITTIHSFCSNLIKEHFNEINLDPSFRVAETGELELLKADVMAEMLEDYYEEGNEEFYKFVETYASGKKDDTLESVILELYRFAISSPWPEEWINSCIKQYESREEIENHCMNYVKGYIEEELGLCMENMKIAYELCSEPYGPYEYKDAIEQNYNLIKNICEADMFNTKVEFIKEKFVQLSRKSMKDVDDKKKNEVKDIYSKVKTKIAYIKKNFLFEPEDEMISEILAAKPATAMLIKLTNDFLKRFALAKSEKNIIDFNDLEHMALNILYKNDGQKVVKTETAYAVAEQFDEVMVDEYQDSNYVQEMLLSAVSSDDKNNLFMVGDVKQSIYRFRMARPEIFINKYKEFPLSGEGNNIRINLDKNFRSRIEVLDSINFIFNQIMSEKMGDIEYNDEHSLHLGFEYETPPQSQNEFMELHLIDESMENDELEKDYSDESVQEDSESESDELSQNELDRSEAEAELIVAKIKEMINPNNPFQVFDKETKSLRNVKYSDIAILMRATSGWGESILNVLIAEGIPAFSERSEGYFNTFEINVLINMLSILDNVRQDIPLTAVMRSPMFDFTDIELAMIRANHKNMDMYDSIKNYIDIGTDEELKKKLTELLDKIDKYRVMVPYLSIHDLIEYVIEDTGFLEFVSAMPAGNVRKANVMMLKQKAIAYENGSYTGLFNFIRYIEKIKKYRIEEGEASSISENDDVVRIMTIHKSKGLEFPILFIAGTGKKFNMKDTTGNFVIHQDLGIGVDYINTDKRYKAQTVIRKSIARRMKLETLGEELRVLYVALTRAREKLIIVGSVKNMGKSLSEWSEARLYANEKLPFDIISGAKCYLDWIVPALMRNKASKCLYNYIEEGVPFSLPMYETDCKSEIFIRNKAEFAYDRIKQIHIDRTNQNVLKNWRCDYIYNEKVNEQIKENLQYSYPFAADADIPSKLSVSEIKRMSHIEIPEEPEDKIELFETAKEEIIPKFMRESKDIKLAGAGRGTAYHRVLELCDLTIENSYDKIRTMIEELLKQELIDEAERDAIDVKKISAFLNSQLSTRMANADKACKLYREQPFVIGISASEVDKNYSPNEQILVQGIIDVYFEEDNELVIADYKTDNVSDITELVERYRVQLDYYGRALEQITGKKVKEKIIYSIKFDDEISFH